MTSLHAPDQPSRPSGPRLLGSSLPHIQQISGDGPWVVITHTCPPSASSEELNDVLMAAPRQAPLELDSGWGQARAF